MNYIALSNIENEYNFQLKMSKACEEQALEENNSALIKARFKRERMSLRKNYIAKINTYLR